MDLPSYLREEKLSQAQFARRLGATEPAVSRWVNGKARPSWARLVEIAAATNGRVTAADFMPPPGEASAGATADAPEAGA